MFSDKEPHEQKKIELNKKHIQDGFHLRGIATLPNKSNVACGTLSVREIPYNVDWLIFYIPMGALATAYDVGGYPFSKDIADHIVWMVTIEKWLYNIADHVFKHIDFKLGLIGLEVSGDAYSSEIASDGIPDIREMGYLIEGKDKDTLEFLPANWFNRETDIFD
ncbi:MAG: hypothetical protein RLP44_11935 [Aggregatilineales bacterium]